MCGDIRFQTAAAQRSESKAIRIDQHPRAGPTVGGAFDRHNRRQRAGRLRLQCSTIRFQNCLNVFHGAFLDQFIQSDRQIADPFARGMIDCVRDRRRCADNADLADPFDPYRVYIRIKLVQKRHIESEECRH